MFTIVCTHCAPMWYKTQIGVVYFYFISKIVWYGENRIGDVYTLNVQVSSFFLKR
jgi:hypothetical protein